jgi:hydrogenase maturation protein HypF
MPSYRIIIRGVVQGVGFRPWVKRLADRLQINGGVCNTSNGVVIDLDDVTASAAEEFVDALRRDAPPLAHIEECLIEEVSGNGAAPLRGFTIEPSLANPDAFTLISPDIATCRDCLREGNDATDRRFHYPFTNCTNCGPRYSIVRRTPYDRANTTMAAFTMCADCAAEYGDSGDRRFHAEPIACPVCGPRLASFPDAAGNPVEAALTALRSGEIVAIKGLGGFQLACDALSAGAVRRLRERKRRNRKPFAIMMRDIAAIERFCFVSAAERDLLAGPAAPIVLLTLRAPGSFPDEVAPGLDEIGVMLPYTPLHHFLFESSLECLVMTSGNISEEPIAIDNTQARIKLSTLADRFLLHDRDIFMRVDDSVARVAEGSVRMVRRSRGYAPQPIDLGFDFGEVLACGAELKNTFCLTKGKYAILSQHIGDMENLETLQFFEETLGNLKSVYHAEPRAIAHDLHPDYLSTRWARAQALPKIAVQHHHAHIASCMAENHIHEPVIGIAFDGAGYGSDGQVWGGEFLICGYEGFERAAHFRYVPFIGGDRAAREGWRMAASYLFDAFGDDYRAVKLALWNEAPEVAWKNFHRLLRGTGPRTSSCGRLFDAVAALTGVCVTSSYEGEAAMRLESAANGESEAIEESYPVTIDDDTWPWRVDTRSMIRAIAEECTRGYNAGRIAARFHNSIGTMMKSLCLRLRERTGLNKVCLSGGTFQNVRLLGCALRLLRAGGFEVFTHSRIPSNDGGISLGQAAIAACLLNREGK